MCCSPWDYKELDTTEQLNDNVTSSKVPYFLKSIFWNQSGY